MPRKRETIYEKEIINCVYTIFFLPQPLRNILFSYTSDDITVVIERKRKKIKDLENYLKKAASFEIDAIIEAIQYFGNEITKLEEISEIRSGDYPDNFMLKNDIKEIYRPRKISQKEYYRRFNANAWMNPNENQKLIFY